MAAAFYYAHIHNNDHYRTLLGVSLELSCKQVHFRHSNPLQMNLLLAPLDGIGDFSELY